MRYQHHASFIRRALVVTKLTTKLMATCIYMFVVFATQMGKNIHTLLKNVEKLQKKTIRHCSAVPKVDVKTNAVFSRKFVNKIFVNAESCDWKGGWVVRMQM